VARDPVNPPTEVSDRHERFAAVINAECGAILASFANGLEASHSPLAAEPCALDRAMTSGSEIIADVVASVRDGAQAGDRPTMLASLDEEGKAGSRLSPADLLSAAAIFFDVTVSSLVSHVRNDPELLPYFVIAILALNESISVRLREATLAYTGYLLEQVDQAHVDERRRIARELHDRLGEGMSAALRQLELHEITSQDQPAIPRPRVAIAKDALTEAIHRLRVVTSDLRQESVRSLETALVQYIDSVTTDADVRLRVSGDEAWASHDVIEETFLIVREAIRNALQHGDPHQVLIRVALAPHEMRAWVEDDGRGFAPARGAPRALAGTGLASMRERAALMAGRLTIASVPGQGTRVEFLVPLPGHRDDQRR